MPLYEYEHLQAPDGACEDPFEELEPIGAEPRERCPRCGQPVRRVPARFASHKNTLSKSNVKDHGFTRLRRRDKGVYEAD